jgi:hypothetical protein
MTLKSLITYNNAATSIDQFPLEAEIALSEMRSEETLTRRLQSFHCLRVRRRGDVVGILLDDDAWQHLVQHVARLEAEVEAREDEVALMIVAERAPGATFAPSLINTSPKSSASSIV